MNDKGIQAGMALLVLHHKASQGEENTLCLGDSLERSSSYSSIFKTVQRHTWLVVYVIYSNNTMETFWFQIQGKDEYRWVYTLVGLYFQRKEADLES